jgi:hypothetical protein
MYKQPVVVDLEHEAKRSSLFLCGLHRSTTTTTTDPRVGANDLALCAVVLQQKVGDAIRVCVINTCNNHHRPYES